MEDEQDAKFRDLEQRLSKKISRNNNQLKSILQKLDKLEVLLTGGKSKRTGRHSRNINNADNGDNGGTDRIGEPQVADRDDD